MTIELYESENGEDILKSDPKYHPTKKWAEHVRFELKTVGPAMRASDGGTNSLIIATAPSDHSDRVHKDVPNPGTERTSRFHAGLQYYFGDVGNRIEMTCSGTQYFSDSAGGAPEMKRPID